MKKEKAIELWQDKLAGEISEKEEKQLQNFLLSNPALAGELNELEQTWELFDEIERPSPSDQMDARFEGMLTAYQQHANESSFSILNVISSFISRSWQVGLASLVLGLFLGWWMLPSQSQSENISNLSSEIQDMKELMMLTLIERPKAQERIRGVNMVSELPNADGKVINALITTLNHDDNLNVRLAALESLLLHSQLPEVRGALIDALKMQESAIMLVAIADALVAIQANGSVEAMEELKLKVEDDLVKDKLEESIKSLQSI